MSETLETPQALEPIKFSWVTYDSNGEAFLDYKEGYHGAFSAIASERTAREMEYTVCQSDSEGGSCYTAEGNYAAASKGGNVTITRPSSFPVAAIEVSKQECDYVGLLTPATFYKGLDLDLVAQPSRCSGKFCWVPISFPGDDVKYTFRTGGNKLTVRKPDGSVSSCTGTCEYEDITGGLVSMDREGYRWGGKLFTVRYHRPRNITGYICGEPYLQFYSGPEMCDSGWPGPVSVQPYKCPYYPAWGIYSAILPILGLAGIIAGAVVPCCCGCCSCCGCYCCCGPAKPENLIVEA